MMVDPSFAKAIFNSYFGPLSPEYMITAYPEDKRRDLKLSSRLIFLPAVHGYANVVMHFSQRLYLLPLTFSIAFECCI